MKYTISVLVENEFGVLTRVSGLFSGRGYNIDSLTVAETLDPHVSRITLVTSGNTADIEQIMKQINKLVNVIKVRHMTAEDSALRQLAYIKVAISQKNRLEVIKSIELLSGEIVDVDDKCCIVELRGNDEKIQNALKLLKAYGILEFVQSGTVAIHKGKKVMG